MKRRTYKINSKTNPNKLSFKPYETRSLGCLGCLDIEDCGGNHSSPGIYNCEDFCQCDDPKICTDVCRNNPDFVARLQEVRGWKLDNIPHSKIIPYPALPLTIPVIYHKYRRVENLSVEAVAIPLKDLYIHKTGEIKFSSKKEVAENFRFDEKAKLIIVGIDDDPFIENYWTHRRATKLPEGLARLQPDLVMSPNYSLPIDVPRQDNLYNIKRIALVWSELVSAGIPTSLHINARTDTDWQKWIEFVQQREEIQCLSFEFATGGAINEQGDYYAYKLTEMAKSVDRNLTIVIKGGRKYIQSLRSVYNNFVFMDSTSFMKTVKRRVLIWQPGDKATYRKYKTEKNEPLDFLLNRNIKTTAEMIEYEAISYKLNEETIIAAGIFS